MCILGYSRLKGLMATIGSIVVKEGLIRLGQNVDAWKEVRTALGCKQNEGFLQSWNRTKNIA
jgi:hypothetical protein